MPVSLDMTPWRVVYGLATRIALPFVLVYFAWRGRAEPAYRRHWRERLGWVAGCPEGTLWIHAASVGEVVLAAPLVAALIKRSPDTCLLVTTTTPTGRAEAQRRLGGQARIAYVPLDTPGATKRFIARARPMTGIFVETELWPNLITAARRGGTRLALVNANVSERSAGRYGQSALKAAVCFMLSSFDYIGAAEPAHAERFIALGASSAATDVTGNLKYDQPAAPERDAQARALRGDWQATDRPIWIVASTHPPEEFELLKAFATLRERHPRLLCVLVPRHPQRFDAVAALIADAGWRCARRSLSEPVDAAIDIVLGDTLGELPLFYAVGDVVFVGGSLGTDIGGHNVIEAAAAARPLVTGPDIREWREPLADLMEAGGALVATDLDAITSYTDAWLYDSEKRVGAGRAASAVVDRHRGALDRTLAGLASLLPRAIGTPRASGGSRSIID